MTEFFLAILALAIAAFALWALRTRWRPKAGPDNNWRNEDFLARDVDGTWAEGSTNPKSAPHDSTGIGIS
jgi:hypothetical protein